MRQLYADFNDIGQDGILSLTCMGSMQSILELQPPLQDGERVLLSDGELEVIAEVRARREGVWEARSTWDFISIESKDT